MLETLKKILLVSRPISWVNTAYPFGVAYILAGGDNFYILAIGIVFFLIPYNLLMYGVNDIFDYESDIRNPRKGGIEGMKEQRALHPTIAKAVVVTTVPFVVYLFAVGSFLASVVLLVVLFFVVAYSIAKLRFKERPFLDSLTSSIHFVGPALYGLSLVQVTPSAWPYLVAFLCWGMASHAFGAVQDIIPDREGRIASIATVLGARTTVLFAALLYGSAAIIMAFQPYPYALISGIGLLYIINIAKLFSITDKTSFQANKPWRRFIWLNLLSGFLITLILLFTYLSR